jgi:tetratricopeptide (TPR) repeat protein
VRNLLFILCLLCFYTVIAQNQKLNDFERLKAQADVYFKGGAYERAIYLYRACLNYPYLASETEVSLRKQIEKSQQSIQLDDEAMDYLRKGNKSKAIEIITKILQINPSDPYAKANRADLQQSLNSSFSAQDQRLLNRANEYIAKEEWEKANTLLRLIDKMPNSKHDPMIAKKIQMTRDLAQAERGILEAKKSGNSQEAKRIAQNSTSKYGSETKASPIFKSPNLKEPSIDYCAPILANAKRELDRCNFDRAEVIFANARKMPECQNDRRITRQLAIIRSVKKNKADIQGWLGDASKKPFIEQAFANIYKTNPACIRKEYFDFVFNEGVIKQRNGDCADAIVSFQKAKRISVVLAKRENIDLRINESDTCIKCRDKERIFKIQMALADRLYRNCECDSAVVQWQIAESYLCSTVPTSRKIWEGWRSQIEECEKNKITIVRFSSLMAQAKDLFENKKCEEAKKSYIYADSLQVRCGRLEKSRIDSAIVKCDLCIANQTYERIKVSADSSIRINDKKGALSYYRQAIAYAPADRKKAIETTIARLACEVEQIGCPEPPKPETPNFLIQKVFTFQGGASLTKTFQNQIEAKTSISPVISLFAQLDYISFKGPLSGRIGIGYSHQYVLTETNNNKLLEKFQIGEIQLPISIRLHRPKSSLSTWRPYISLEYIFMSPIVFQYENYLSEVNLRGLKSLSRTNSLLGFGFGIERLVQKRNIFIDVKYNSLVNDIFKENKPTGIYYLAIPQIRSLNLSLGYRF